MVDQLPNFSHYSEDTCSLANDVLLSLGDLRSLTIDDGASRDEITKQTTGLIETYLDHHAAAVNRVATAESPPNQRSPDNELILHSAFIQWLDLLCILVETPPESDGIGISDCIQLFWDEIDSFDQTPAGGSAGDSRFGFEFTIFRASLSSFRGPAAARPPVPVAVNLPFDIYSRMFAAYLADELR
jgi:hypothetical protein